MPTPALKSLAKQSGKSMGKMEKYWDKAKDLAAEQGHRDDYAYITGIVKRMAGIGESIEESVTSYQRFFYKLKEDYGELESIVSNINRTFPVEKLWVDEQTQGITIRALVIDREHRNRGFGTRIVKQILDYANIKQKPVAITPSEKYGGYISRIVAWAKVLGFVYNTGKKKDYRLPETMIYFPRKSEIEIAEE
jgi:GNAT superfamily N-acetyltransferase